MVIGFGILPLKKVPKVDLYLHPIRYGKKVITFEPMGEEAVIALLTKHLCEGKLPFLLENYFEELDEGYLSSESNFDQWDLEELKPTKIIVGRDVKLHPRFQNILRFLGILSHFGGVKIEWEGEPVELPPIMEESERDPELKELAIEEENYLLPDEVPEELPSFNGGVIYRCFDKGVVKEGELLCSTQFIKANRIERVKVKIGNKIYQIKKLPELKGTFGIIYLPNYSNLTGLSEEKVSTGNLKESKNLPVGSKNNWKKKDKTKGIGKVVESWEKRRNGDRKRKNERLDKPSATFINPVSPTAKINTTSGIGNTFKEEKSLDNPLGRGIDNSKDRKNDKIVGQKGVGKSFGQIDAQKGDHSFSRMDYPFQKVLILNWEE